MRLHVQPLPDLALLLGGLDPYGWARSLGALAALDLAGGFRLGDDDANAVAALHRAAMAYGNRALAVDENGAACARWLDLSAHRVGRHAPAGSRAVPLAIGLGTSQVVGRFAIVENVGRGPYAIGKIRDHGVGHRHLVGPGPVDGRS